jgi:hypothetical protein
VALFTGIAAMCLPLIGLAVITETEKESFIGLFFISTALQVIAFILCICLDDKPFNYVRHYNQRQYKLAQPAETPKCEVALDNVSANSVVVI